MGASVRISAIGVVAMLVVAAAAWGQEPPPVCTKVMCRSGVFVDLANAKRDYPKAVAARVCADGRCRRVSQVRGVVRVEPTHLARSPARVVVVLYDKRGKRLLRVARSVAIKRSQPNGPECPPICFSRHLRLETKPARLVATD